MTGMPDWTFRKSSRSADDKCVELGCDQAGVLGAIRDSKNPTGPVLQGSGAIGLLVKMLKAADIG